MMICALDIGNTRLKWRIENTHKIFAALDIQDFLRACDEYKIKRVLVSCVAPKNQYDELWQALQNRGISWVNARVVQDFKGLTLAYRDTQSLGVDRWLAMIAARKKYAGADLILVSAGTAITVDYLTASGKHLGGLIVAGLKLSSGALFNGTNGVGSPAITLPKNWQPGDTTLNCVEHGYSALYRGFLNQAIDSFVGLVSPKIIMTGGDGEILQLLIDQQHKVHLDSALVLDGLSIALE